MFTILENKHTEETREYIVINEFSEDINYYESVGYIPLRTCKKSEVDYFLETYFETLQLNEEEQTILYL